MTAASLSIHEAAQAVREWALQRNLLRVGSGVQSIPAPSVSRDAISASEDAIGILEASKVTAIGLNKKSETIFIYTNRKLSTKNRKYLQENIKDASAFNLEYRTAKPISINPESFSSSLESPAYVTDRGYYACGSSVGIASVRMTGTLGCLVRLDDGNIFGLSNNHVTGGCNNTMKDMPILAPGILDVSADKDISPFTIGRHHSVLTFRQGDPSAINHFENTDAAIFKIVDPNKVSSIQGSSYDTPDTVADLSEDMEVEKVGRTTGHTIGKVESETIGPLSVSYRVTVHHNASDQSQFIGNAFFEPTYLVRGLRGPFSLSGDSGSLVTTKSGDGTRHAVGLVFAGVAPDTSYIIPIRPILERFKATLVSGHNV